MAAGLKREALAPTTSRSGFCSCGSDVYLVLIGTLAKQALSAPEERLEKAIDLGMPNGFAVIASFHYAKLSISKLREIVFFVIILLPDT